jgi:iron complex outermembrane receptor protein
MWLCAGLSSVSGERQYRELLCLHARGEDFYLPLWEKEGTSRVGLECYYTGEQRLEYNPYRDVSRPYVLVGAMGEHKIVAHVKLFLNLENLTDVRQTHWDPLLLPTREADGRWTVDAWAPLDGRVINGGARFSF